MNALNAFLPGLLCFVLALVYPAGSIAGPGLETLRKRVVEELLEPAVNPARIKLLLGSIREDGSWEGINYQDTSRTGFEHSRHLENLLDLARALKKPGSAYYGNPEVERAAGAGLDFWIAHDFLCENWWWNQIGTPDRMVSILLVLDRELSQAQREGAAPIAGRANLEAWGARPGGDLIKIAGILGRYGLFKRDSALVKEAVKAITGEIMFAADRGDPSDLRGLQVDMSFQHRDDRVISTLSYGLGYAEAFAGWAALAAGTEFSFPPEALELLVDFYLDGICRTMVHGKYPDPGAKNRGITRKGALRPAGPELPENLLKATSYRKEELREIIKIRRGEAKPALAGSRFFWSSEYFSYQRPDFFASVRMYSSRNHSVEVPYNEEGLKNHHLADGSNFISRTGEEYAGVFPVWDWQKIPGTTVLQKPALPPPDAIQQKGLRSFAGAVSDGRYGAAAVDFKSPLDGLEAKKAWFFFDREYVCLGSGISAPAPYPVATTINQCLLQQEVIVMENGRMSAPEKGVHSFREVSWVFHDSIAYIFPRPVNVQLRNKRESGNWRSINHQAGNTSAEVHQELFSLWLDHGSSPSGASYEYIVLPGVSAAEAAAYKKGSAIEILANSPDIQAVRHNGLNLCQALFYKAGELQMSDSILLGIDSPGLVMLGFEGGTIRKISIADPSRELSSIHLKVSGRLHAGRKDVRTVWNDEKGHTDIYIRLPEGEYAGKSVVIDL